MHVSAIHFKRKSSIALRDTQLQQAMDGVKNKFISHRLSAIEAYSEKADFEKLRERGRLIRNESIHLMPKLLQQFEKNAKNAGSEVLWAANSETANRLIADIARRHNVRLAVKSKSMATEETRLNSELEKAGIEVVETDLGEFILQLAGEVPSHIIAPAMHKKRADIARHFAGKVDYKNDNIKSLTHAARLYLRDKFINADMGISGANYLIADTGSTLIVTNEGNGRMVSTLPRVRVVLAGIDKIIARFADTTDMLTLLTTSATGQRISNYVSVSTGCRRRDDEEGAEFSYVILLDNGRSRLRQDECWEMLRCIRCGACMNHCPVYNTVGGHAYGSVYMGPMGQVLTPLLAGLENAPELPHATTMCGACAVVCPVKIPLPDLMRKLRERQVRQKTRPLIERLLMALWFFAASHPPLYGIFLRLFSKTLRLLGDGDGVIKKAPLGWFMGRNLVVPKKPPFRSMRKKLGL